MSDSDSGAAGWVLFGLCQRKIIIVLTEKMDVQRGRHSTLFGECVFLVRTHSVIRGGGDTRDSVQPITWGITVTQDRSNDLTLLFF